jgi:predicted nucleic acid-binding protein
MTGIKENEKAEEKIYLDTFIFMDILSGDPALSAKAASYLDGKKHIISSIILTELAYHLRRRKSREKTEEVLFYIQSLPDTSIIPVTEEIGRHAGILRAKYRRLKFQKKFTYFDCIHLATAISEGCKKFVTGDRGFSGIQEIKVEIY